MSAADHLLHAVAARIRQLRNAAGISQEELALRLGTAVPNLQRMEFGRQNLTLRSLHKVADALGVPVIALFQEGSGHQDEAAARRAPLRLRLVEAAGWRPLPKAASTVGAVPVLDLRVVGGAEGELHEPQVVAWVVPPPDRRLVGEGWFLARVYGASMAPRVPSGAWCLFRRPVQSPLFGKIVVVRVAGPSLDYSYHLKKIASLEEVDDGKVRVRLDSSNPTVEPIFHTVRSEDELDAVGEFVELVHGDKYTAASRKAGASKP